MALDESLSFWIPRIVLISSQIVLLLIFANVLPPLANLASHRHLEDVAKEHLQYHQEQKRSVEAITGHVKELTGILLILVPLLTVLSAIPEVPMAIWALPVCAVLIKLTLCYRIILNARRDLEESLAANTTDGVLADPQLPGGEEDEQEPCTRETVVAFFLNLFKHQLGVSEETPSAFSPVEDEPFTGSYVYELRVQAGHDLKTRRMTIAPLGEESGSRSRCFYVIYDDHLVIKVPPTHIENLSHYIESLRREAHIIDRLAMKECVIPRVSAILKRIHTFPDEAHFTPEEIEGRYMKWLIASPESQKYLRIGQGFAFFMDFSKYYFLEHIIEYLHDTKEKMYREIRGHSEILWDLTTLENNYGPESLPVFSAIGQVYNRYEKRIRRLLSEYDLSSSVTPYHIKEWFFTYLAKDEVTDLEKALDPEFMVDLDELLKNVMATHVESVDNYRNTARAIVSEKQFAQTSSSMKGLVANHLDLLARLRQKGVALRDLKPDNLLVAGDPGRYPEFLSHSDEYQIGIIDVETAVILEGTTEEPQLGGTPHYATPSHFFGNEVLRHAFIDVPKTLHLQDWHAMVGIIYRVITGGVLFDKTAQLVPGMVRMIRNCSGSPQALFGVFNDVSPEFWSKAAAEFTAKMAQEAETLRSVDIAIPNTARAMLKECILEENEQTAGAIRECVMSQRAFSSDKNRKYLLSCPHEKVMDLLKKYSHGAAGEAFDTRHITGFLRKLGRLKLRWEQRTAMAHLLDEYDPPSEPMNSWSSCTALC